MVQKDRWAAKTNEVEIVPPEKKNLVYDENKEKGSRGDNCTGRGDGLHNGGDYHDRRGHARGRVEDRRIRNNLGGKTGGQNGGMGKRGQRNSSQAEKAGGNKKTTYITEETPTPLHQE